MKKDKKIVINKPFVSVYSSSKESTMRTYSVCDCCKSCKGK